MKKYINEDFIKIIISLLLFIISFFIPIETIKIAILVLSYGIIAYELYIESFKDIMEGEIFNECFLMIIASLGAFYIGSTTEAVMVILLFQIGEYLSDLAVNKSKESITKLMDLRVSKATVLENNHERIVKIEQVKVNDLLMIKPGEKIPLDGIVIEGESYLDTSSLTGESVPRKVVPNDTVLSGCINKEGILKVKSTSTYKTSTSQKIIDLIENSNETKSNTETFIQKFAKIYTPIVVLIAFLIALVPTLLGYDFNDYLYRALVFLVTSCPCALVISVPLGYFCGIGKSSREGILIKGSKELENLSNIDYLLLDKTGTITEGTFEVTKIKTDMEENDFINIIASAETNSIHPIAKAINEKNKKKLKKVTEYKEIAGEGISCVIDNKKILVGNQKLMEKNSVNYKEIKEIGTLIYVAIDNEFKGYVVISDKIKKSSFQLKDIKECIKKDIIILSGDNKQSVEEVAQKTGIKKYYSNLLPIDKVNHVKEYKKKGKVMFVGDGINDAPVIKIADIGVSMGGIGSDAAIEASDIVLMKDDLIKIKTAIKISEYTKKKVTQSIVFALLIKAIVLVLGILGISTIWMAVFADVGVTLLVIVNVLQIFFKNYEKSYIDKK